MTYFKGCETIEDVKARFKDLAKKLHPDCGGDAEQFKAMMNEYNTAFNRYRNIHRNAEGETYTKEPEGTQETPEQFAEIINTVIHMTGVNIEIIGAWVWLTGNTMIYKDQIKAAGFWWSKSKKAWYHTGETGGKRKRRGHYSMKQLRERYGTVKVDTEEQQQIGA